MRAKCLKARRHAQRARTESARTARKETLKKLKDVLSIAIKKSKKSKFKELCDGVNDNPWGDGYRIVMTKLRGPSVPRETCPVKLKEVVDVLFPQHEETGWSDEEDVTVDSTEPEVTDSELIEAVRRLKRNKAPGPDGIPNEVIKILVKKYTGVFRRVMQGCMQRACFPDCWKRQKLVLIPKPGKPRSDPSSFRPIGLLDGLGKLLEKMILNRLQKYTEGDNGLSENQFGFRKGRRTVNAITTVTDVARKAIKNSTKYGRYCAVTTIDVKNAFNSASWRSIDSALENVGTSEQLRKIVRSYLTNRVLLYDRREECVQQCKLESHCQRDGENGSIITAPQDDKELPHESSSTLRHSRRTERD